MSQEQKLSISKGRIGQFVGNKSPSWKGGISKDKNHLKTLVKNWKINNMDKVLFSNKRRRDLKRGSKLTHTLKEWNDMKIKYDYICPSCGRKEPDIKLTQDHIVPLYSGGDDSINNIQPLCGSCNSRKHLDIIKYEVNICKEL